MSTNSTVKKNIYQTTLLLAVFLLMMGLAFALARPAKVIADCREIPLSDVEPAVVTMTDEGFDTDVIEATQCSSTLFIINQSSKNVSLAFGEHVNHVHYAGFDETILAPDEQTEIILYQYGDFNLHNHFNEEYSIDLRVAKNETLIQFASFQDAIPYDTESHNENRKNDDIYYDSKE